MEKIKNLVRKNWWVAIPFIIIGLMPAFIFPDSVSLYKGDDGMMYSSSVDNSYLTKYQGTFSEITRTVPGTIIFVLTLIIFSAIAIYFSRGGSTFIRIIVLTIMLIIGSFAGLFCAYPPH